MHTVEIEGKEYDLKAIENVCWQRIISGAMNPGDPFHLATVANVNQHGVNMRLVVLRDADINKKQLVFHTDIRSGKWHELITNPHIGFLFYNAADKVQVRLSGSITLHQNDQVADDAWAACSINTRKTYLGVLAPSTIVDEPISGLPASFEDENPTPGESEQGRQNFGVVVTKTDWMEWMWLNKSGNRRASFHYMGQQDFKADWLIP